MNKTSLKQKIGLAFISMVLLCTGLAIAGIWGFIEGQTAWQMFWTLIAVAVGLGVSGGMVDTFFPDPEKGSIITAAVVPSKTHKPAGNDD